MNIATFHRFICLILPAVVIALPTVAQTSFTAVEADAVRTFLRQTFTNSNSGMVVGLLASVW